MFTISSLCLPTSPAVPATFSCAITSLWFSNPTNAAITVTVLDGFGHPLIPSSEIPATGRIDFVTKYNPTSAINGFSVQGSASGAYFSAEWSPE